MHNENEYATIRDSYDPELHSSFYDWVDDKPKLPIWSWIGMFLIYALVAVSITVLGLLFINSWAATGPGCFEDPTYLGFCSEIDHQ